MWLFMLSLPKKEVKDDTNYELLQEVYKYVNRRIEESELQIKQLETKQDENNTFVDSADFRQLDSLESRLFRR